MLKNLKHAGWKRTSAADAGGKDADRLRKISRQLVVRLAAPFRPDSWTVAAGLLGQDHQQLQHARQALLIGLCGQALPQPGNDSRRTPLFGWDMRREGRDGQAQLSADRSSSAAILQEQPDERVPEAWDRCSWQLLEVSEHLACMGISVRAVMQSHQPR